MASAGQSRRHIFDADDFVSPLWPRGCVVGGCPPMFGDWHSGVCHRMRDSNAPPPPPVPAVCVRPQSSRALCHPPFQSQGGRDALQSGYCFVAKYPPPGGGGIGMGGWVGGLAPNSAFWAARHPPPPLGVRVHFWGVLGFVQGSEIGLNFSPFFFHNMSNLLALCCADA